MPYQGEFAQHRALKRLLEDDLVKALLSESKQREPGDGSLVLPYQAKVVPSAFEPRLVLAIDGGQMEIPLRNGYPGAEAGYVSVAGVLMDLRKLRELESEEFIDPSKFDEVESVQPASTVLPGCNVIYRNKGSARDSFRLAFHQSLRRCVFRRT
ncbi:MAG: DNA double-strand break repair nuclease NurA [Burkholderiaceae bacterium]|nr:DNA double-strand break repair nuclease NurA [Burkholderiaceae bacterium]